MSAPRYAPLVLAAIAFALSAGAPGIARGSETVYGVLIGGRPVDREGASGRMRSGHVYVNVVRFTRALAGVITFHDSDRSTLVTVGGHSVKFTLGTKEATIDDIDTVLTAAPFVENGDTYVPLDALAKVAGVTFTTDAKQKLVMVVQSGTGSLLVPAATTPVEVPASAAPAPAPAAS